MMAYPVFLLLFLGISIITTANAGMACGTVDTRNTFRGMLSSDAEIYQQIESITLVHKDFQFEQTRLLGFLRESPNIKVNMALYRSFQCSFGFMCLIKYTHICFN